MNREEAEKRAKELNDWQLAQEILASKDIVAKIADALQQAAEEGYISGAEYRTDWQELSEGAYERGRRAGWEQWRAWLEKQQSHLMVCELKTFMPDEPPAEETT